MNNSSAFRAAAIERAARVIQAAKLRVLDRAWSSGVHHLDLVASPGSDILAAVEVRVTGPCAAGACVTTLTEARFWQATDAARAWTREREAPYSDVWVVLVAVDSAGGVEVVTGNATEVS